MPSDADDTAAQVALARLVALSAEDGRTAVPSDPDFAPTIVDGTVEGTPADVLIGAGIVVNGPQTRDDFPRNRR